MLCDIPIESVNQRNFGKFRWIDHKRLSSRWSLFRIGNDLRNPMYGVLFDAEYYLDGYDKCHADFNRYLFV